MLQKLTGGVKQVDFEARNVRQVVDKLEELYPGMKDSLLEEGKIKPSLAVAIDGEVARMGLLERLKEDCEVHFVPAIGGGEGVFGPGVRSHGDL
jgi:molybdopterin synthase sulfur carrier subunit